MAKSSEHLQFLDEELHVSVRSMWQHPSRINSIPLAYGITSSVGKGSVVTSGFPARFKAISSVSEQGTNAGRMYMTAFCGIPSRKFGHLLSVTDLDWTAAVLEPAWPLPVIYELGAFGIAECVWHHMLVHSWPGRREEKRKKLFTFSGWNCRFHCAETLRKFWSTWCC